MCKRLRAELSVGSVSYQFTSYSAFAVSRAALDKCVACETVLLHAPEAHQFFAGETIEVRSALCCNAVSGGLDAKVHKDARRLECDASGACIASQQSKLNHHSQRTTHQDSDDELTSAARRNACAPAAYGLWAYLGYAARCVM